MEKLNAVVTRFKEVMKNKKIQKITGIAGGVLLLLLVVCSVVALSGRSTGTNEKKQATAEKETKKETKKEDTEKQDEKDNASKDEGKSEDKEESPQKETETASAEAVQTPQPTPQPAVPEVYPESEGTRKVYLTFDDGTSEQTDKILDILAQYGVKATFFVTAQGGEENAARYRRIVAEGHSIGLHSVSHRYKEVYASLDTFIADVEGIRQFVLDTTGVDTHLYRFPGGSSNSVSNVPIEDCIRYLNQNGYRYFDWNIDTSDAVNHSQSAQELVSRALGENIEKYHNSVILMHDSGSQHRTVEALPGIIEGLKARGLEILPITENTPAVQHKKASSVQ